MSQVHFARRFFLNLSALENRTMTARFALCTAAALFAVSLAANAQALEMFTTDGTGGIRNDAGFTIGNEFVVGSQNIVVTALGIWDGTSVGDGTDGLNHAHEVGVWDSLNTLLTSVTVPAGTAGTLIGEVRYASVGTPIVLQKNLTYYLGGLFASLTSEPFREYSNTPALSADFASSTATYNVNPTTLMRPTGVAGPGIYFGPNLQYTVPVAQLTETPDNGSAINFTVIPQGPTTLTLTDAVTLENTGDFGSEIDITGYTITGPNDTAFQLIGFAPLTLTAGFADLVDYDLTLDTTSGASNYSALLTFMTSAGNVSFDLNGNIVPEPNSFALAVCGLAAFVVRRRRRR
jgi:hypothetical protein